MTNLAELNWRRNPSGDSHVPYIAWENNKRSSEQRFTLYEKAVRDDMTAPHEKKSTYEYGTLFLLFETYQVYAYRDFPYRYYYYLWKNEAAGSGHWGRYYYYRIARMHMSKDRRNPEENKRVCPWTYKEVK